MIDAIYQIGKLVKSDNFLNDLVLDENFDYIVKVNFDLKNKKVFFEKEESDLEKRKEYLWLGNPSGNNPKIYFTTDNLEYIITKIIPDFESYLSDYETNFEELKKKIENVKKEFFLSKNQEKKEIYYLDWNKLDDFMKKMEEYNNYKDEKDKLKTENFIKFNSNKNRFIIENYEDAIKKLYNFEVKTEKGKNRKYLYVILIDGKTLLDDENYKNILIYENLDKLFDKNENSKDYLINSKCTLCGNETDCSSKEFPFKFYNTDKPGFSSKLDGKFTKNFLICKGCYNDVKVGAVFIRNRLTSRIGIYNFMILPYFNSTPSFDLKEKSEIIKNIFSPLSNIKSILEFEGELKKYQIFDDPNNYFTFDYLFYNEKQASFKLIKVIKDVSPSRFKKIIENIDKINKNTLLPFSYSIKKIYYTFLIKTGKNSQDTFYIDILDSLIHGKYINLSQVYKNSLAIYKKIYYDSFSGYNLNNYYKEGKSNLYFVRNFLNSTAFLRLAYYLNCVKKEDKDMDDFKEKILLVLNNFKQELEEKIKEEKDNKKKETLNFIKNKYENIISYFELTKNTINDLHRALVLIGIMISRVAQKQSGKGHSSYPILNKINFQGMKLKDIQGLYNIIYEKLKQYNLVSQSSNNSLMELISEIMSTYQKEWDKTISKEENVYYILSGFSMGILSTYKPEEDEKLEDETIEEGDEDLTEDE